MIRSVCVALCALVLGSAAGQAQEQTGRSMSRGIDEGAYHHQNVTQTGETVPLPGLSKSEGTTSLDRGIQRRDDEITHGICSGC